MFYLAALLYANPMILFGRQKINGIVIGTQVARILLGLFIGFFSKEVLLIEQNFAGIFFTYAFTLGLVHLVAAFLTESEGNMITGSFGILLILASLFMLFIYPITFTKELHALVDVKVEEKPAESLNLDFIPTVPHEVAEYKGEKVIGELDNPSFYTPGEYSIQKIGEELVWVAPIEFSGFFKVGKAVSTPGYIKVSATDVNAKAEIVDGYEMKIVPSAYFGDDMMRRVRNSYPKVVLAEASFEPNDEGKPFYAISYGHYMKHRTGLQIDGVILVDPENGEVEQYKLSEVPSFVDQVIPQEVAEKYNSWYGKYKQGFFNSLFAQVGVHVPTDWETGDKVIATFTDEGHMVWTTDHTRPSSESKSMVGYSILDAKTGMLTYYSGSNGLLTGEAAIGAVDKTFIKNEWTGTAPILYNIYGEETFVVPVMDGNHMLRTVAVVHAESGKVVNGETKNEAFRNYSRLLASGLSDKFSPSEDAKLSELTGIVARINNVSGEEGDVFYILIEGSEKIFTVSPIDNPFVVITNEGDKVTVNYFETGEVIVSTQNMENHSLK